jgi:predicted nuclease with TOPRIM domain
MKKGDIEELNRKMLELQQLVSTYDILGVLDRRIAELQEDLKKERERYTELQKELERLEIYLGKRKPVAIPPRSRMPEVLSALELMEVGQRMDLLTFYRMVGGASRGVQDLLELLERRGDIKIEKVGTKYYIVKLREVELPIG